MSNTNNLNKNIISEKYIEAYYKLESLIKNIYNEYEVKDMVNPIENFKCDLKKLDSIKNKLAKSGLECIRENVDELHDVVRARIVCPFLSDVYNVVDVISKQQNDDNGIIVYKIKDYIENPKESGYRSCHLLIKIPVFSNGIKEYVNAEIQVRTVAMDMLFSLEHKLRYKKKVEYPKELEKNIEDVTISCGELDVELDKVVKSVEEDNSYDFSVPYPFMEDENYKVLKSKYLNALDFISKKFKKIYDNYGRDDGINPIEHMKYRIKSDDKIIRKLYFDDREVNFDNIYKFVKDVAGFRIVCSFLSDVEELKEHIEQLKSNNELIIVDPPKDYINNPKESGYRGFHYVVFIRVNSLEGIIYVPVEIQIRTVAMEMWASLEEKICYHKKSSDVVKSELKKMAEKLEKFDNDVDSIYRAVSKEEKVDAKVRVRSRFGRK